MGLPAVGEGVLVARDTPSVLQRAGRGRHRHDAEHAGLLHAHATVPTPRGIYIVYIVYTHIYDISEVDTGWSSHSQRSTEVESALFERKWPRIRTPACLENRCCDFWLTRKDKVSAV